MEGRLCAIVLATTVAVAAMTGDAGARGGNHGCVEDDRRVFSSHFFESGDNVVAGFFRQEVGFPPSEQENVVVENRGNDGSGPSGLRCGADFASWSLFESRLGPGNDSVRLDARGLENKYPEPPQPLPPRIKSLLKGGPGDDDIRGHRGRDNVIGGPGDDVIRPFGSRDRVRAGSGADNVRVLDGRKDNVRCGPGRDLAIADISDRIRGCERVITPS